MLNTSPGAVKWERLKYSRNQVAKCGKRLSRLSHPELEDLEILHNWRAAHAYVLSIFVQGLNRKIRDLGVKNVVVTQRLKMKSTIIDKLVQGRSSDLSTMNDIAGCRVICSSLEELDHIRSAFNSRKVLHRRTSEEKFNYLLHPKNSGYRGIHDVFSHEGKTAGMSPWNNLRVEIQYRTQVQHAWATGVEVCDRIFKDRLKFGQGENEHAQLFSLWSEILARRQETMNSCHPDLSSDELRSKIISLESHSKVLNAFGRLLSFKGKIQSGKNLLLSIGADQQPNVRSFSSFPKALDAAEAIERAGTESAFAVAVRGRNTNELRSAFRNYFNDTKDLVKLVKESLRDP
jgi:ppGpp synthetase/RelA/SpoT-type nucleotidyltranferase